jgi:hypothetical protein
MTKSILVPVEASPEMIEAGNLAYLDALAITHIYKAMLAAAPALEPDEATEDMRSGTKSVSLRRCCPKLRSSMAYESDDVLKRLERLMDGNSTKALADEVI